MEVEEGSPIIPRLRIDQTIKNSIFTIIILFFSKSDKTNVKNTKKRETENKEKDIRNGTTSFHS